MFLEVEALLRLYGRLLVLLNLMISNWRDILRRSSQRTVLEAFSYCVTVGICSGSIYHVLRHPIFLPTSVHRRIHAFELVNLVCVQIAPLLTRPVKGCSAGGIRIHELARVKASIIFVCGLANLREQLPRHFLFPIIDMWVKAEELELNGALFHSGLAGIIRDDTNHVARHIKDASNLKPLMLPRFEH